MYFIRPGDSVLKIFQKQMLVFASVYCLRVSMLSSCQYTVSASAFAFSLFLLLAFGDRSVENISYILARSRCQLSHDYG